MDFQQFLAWSNDTLHLAPRAERYCETRIGRAFAHLKPGLEDLARSQSIHRCDLARLWCQSSGIQPSSRTVLISEGVRHSLEVIFSILADSGLTTALPTDVYPVYWRIARQANLPTIGFDTFPHFDLHRILNDADRAGARYLLVPLPLKLQGRKWTAEETANAEDWLRADGRRRIILDRVYAFGAAVDCQTRQLLATDQVLLLDSLSKGWLHEQVFGVSVIPEQDVAIYTAAFRNLVPSPTKLCAAQELLTRHRYIPLRLTAELESRRAALIERAAQTGHRILPPEQGYLVALECSSEELLMEHSLVTIPASVFGSAVSNWSVASALSIVE